jgi:hypothetical protein
LNELVSIDLGFTLCRKGIKGFVSNLLVIVNIPAEAIGIPNIFYDEGRESGIVCHDLSCANAARFTRKISQNWLTNQFHSLKTTKALAVNTIEAAGDEPEFHRTTGDPHAQSGTHKSGRTPRERS